MGLIKQRRQRRLRKEATIAAQKREVRLRKQMGYTRMEIAAQMNLPESSILKLYKDA